MKTAVLMFGLLFTVIIQVNSQNYQSSLEQQTDLCNSGTQQSPINIIRQKNTNPICQDIRFSLEKPSQQGGTQGGQSDEIFTIELLGEKGSVKKYKYLNFTSHSMAEHAFDNQQTNFDLNLVSQQQDTKEDQMAIFSVLFQVVRTDNQESSFLTKLLNKTRAQSTVDKTAFFNEIFQNVLKYGNKIHSYNGSLTTSPCSENVQWIIFEEPINISLNNKNYFKKIIFGEKKLPPTGNNRPVQPRNGRNVTYAKLCEPSESS